jgi:hypothetical protein
LRRWPRRRLAGRKAGGAEYPISSKETPMAKERVDDLQDRLTIAATITDNAESVPQSCSVIAP